MLVSAVGSAGGGSRRTPHSLRQSGHDDCLLSHCWMHSSWKACSSEHGSTLSRSLSAKSPMQMAHCWSVRPTSEAVTVWMASNDSSVMPWF